MERSDSIDEVASGWLVRRQSGSWSAVDQQRFDLWIGASTLHRVAYLRLELAWEDAGRLKALAAGIHSDGPPPARQWNLSPFFSQRDEAPTAGAEPAPLARHIRLFAAAASLLLLVGIGTYFALLFRGERYTTPIGQITSVAMADGSRLTLNTNSQVRVAMTKGERHIDLAYGEAFFHVSKDPGRPFVVEAGGKRVIAVGTQFSVRREGNDVEVVVTEGRVRVEDAGVTELTPGSVAHAGDGGILVRRESVSDSEQRLSWRSGWLSFRDQTLADATAEFNRYNETQILIRDSAVAALRIEGNFRATNVDAFVRLLSSEFPVQASHEGKFLVISAK
ncbi:MAG: hypothetical protein RL684_1896 [Pseudomonadota bacterium]